MQNYTFTILDSYWLDLNAFVFHTVIYMKKKEKFSIEENFLLILEFPVMENFQNFSGKKLKEL